MLIGEGGYIEIKVIAYAYFYFLNKDSRLQSYFWKDGSDVWMWDAFIFGICHASVCSACMNNLAPNIGPSGRLHEHKCDLIEKSSNGFH
jgi:hypothetical protein